MSETLYLVWFDDDSIQHAVRNPYAPQALAVPFSDTGGSLKGNPAGEVVFHSGPPCDAPKCHRCSATHDRAACESCVLLRNIMDDDLNVMEQHDE